MHKRLPATHRYVQLDSLRGLAAIVVFMCHAIGGVLSFKFLVKMDTSPLGFFLNGNAALMYFFVLSGFVLSLPFIDNKQPLNLTAFYTRRIFRIYPAFIAAILLAVVLKAFIFQQRVVQNAGVWFNQHWLWQWNAASVKELLRTLCLVHPAMDINFIDPPIWSLVVEMKMSLILPFFILLVSRCNLAANLALLFILSCLEFNHHGAFANVFYLGVILAKYRHALIDLVKDGPMTIKILVLLCSIVLYNTGMQILSIQQSPYFRILCYYIPSVGSCFIIVSVIASNRLTRFFEKRLFVFLGSITYSFYLMHFPVLYTISSVMVNRFAYSLYVAVPLALLLTIAIGYLMMISIERPFQNIANTLVKKYRWFNVITVKSNRLERYKPQFEISNKSVNSGNPVQDLNQLK